MTSEASASRGFLRATLGGSACDAACMDNSAKLAARVRSLDSDATKSCPLALR